MQRNLWHVCSILLKCFTGYWHPICTMFVSPWTIVHIFFKNSVNVYILPICCSYILCTVLFNSLFCIGRHFHVRSTFLILYVLDHKEPCHKLRDSFICVIMKLICTLVVFKTLYVWTGILCRHYYRRRV